MVVSPRITSANSTDFSSIRALLASPRFAGKSDQELAVAIWDFMVDPAEGFYHFWSPMERLGGRRVTDPLKLLNVFGWGLCGTNANLMANLFVAAGLDGRCVNLGDHVVPEAFCGGAWRLLDADMRAYHRKRPPDESQIASVADCVADPTLITDQQNPSTPYYSADRSLAKTAELYKTTHHHHRPFAEYAHTMDFALRPGEKLLRCADNEGKWIWFDGYDDLAAKYGDEWIAKGPCAGRSGQAGYANGWWTYEPQLTDAFEDFQRGVFAAEGVASTHKGVVNRAKGRSWLVFDFDSPYVFVGPPARSSAQPPRDGVVLNARVFLKNKFCSARIEIRVDPDASWLTVWESPRAGEHEVKLDLTAHAANAYRYLLRLSFDAPAAGACELRSLKVDSAIMLAPASLGRLADGENELTVRFGDEQGLPTRRRVLATDMTAGDLQAKAHRLENVRFVDGQEHVRVLPADPARDYEIMFKFDAPGGCVLQRMHAFGSFRSRGPEDPDQGQIAAYVATSEDGPWAPIFESPVLADPLRWQFSLCGEQALAAPAPTAFVKLVGRAGLAEARMRATWLDGRAGKDGESLEITHVWAEADGWCKAHTETIDAFDAPHTYALTCGREPKLHSLLMHCPSVRR